MEADLQATFSSGQRRRPPQAQRHRHRRHGPTLEDRLIARMLAPWLDRELAADDGISLSDAHTARAAQLTGERTRLSVARTLDKLTAHASEEAVPLMVALAARLRSPEPIDPSGIARLKTLVTDRRGPCYSPSTPDALVRALHELADLLSS